MRATANMTLQDAQQFLAIRSHAERAQVRLDWRTLGWRVRLAADVVYLCVDPARLSEQDQAAAACALLDNYSVQVVRALDDFGRSQPPRHVTVSVHRVTTVGLTLHFDIRIARALDVMDVLRYLLFGPRALRAGMLVNA